MTNETEKPDPEPADWSHLHEQVGVNAARHIDWIGGLTPDDPKFDKGVRTLRLLMSAAEIARREKTETEKDKARERTEAERPKFSDEEVRAIHADILAKAKRAIESAEHDRADTTDPDT